MVPRGHFASLLCLPYALSFSAVIARKCDKIAKQFGHVTKQSIFPKHQILILKKHGLLRRRLFCSRKTNEAPRNDGIRLDSRYSCYSLLMGVSFVPFVVSFSPFAATFLSGKKHAFQSASLLFRSAGFSFHQAFGHRARLEAAHR
jgi:hypothetical protein